MQWAGKWNVAIEELFPLVSVKLLDEQDAKRPVTILLEKKKTETKQFQYLVFSQQPKQMPQKLLSSFNMSSIALHMWKNCKRRKFYRSTIQTSIIASQKSRITIAGTEAETGTHQLHCSKSERACILIR